MDKIRNPIDSECYAKSSEPFTTSPHTKRTKRPVGPRANLDAVEKRQTLPLQESNIARSAHSLWLCWAISAPILKYMNTTFYFAPLNCK
jgi:hypothetical protein